MTLIRATRTPLGNRGRTGGAPPAVRYAAQTAWPGITHGNNALCTCSWAHRNGRMEIKFVNALCIVAGHKAASGG